MTTFNDTFVDSANSGLALVKETTWGTSPTTGGRRLRFTSETLSYSPTTETSSEIRPDRTVSDVILTNIGASGEISGEFSPGSYDDLLAAALLSPSGAWSGITSDASDAINSAKAFRIKAKFGRVGNSGQFRFYLGTIGGETRFPTAQDQRANTEGLKRGQAIRIRKVAGANAGNLSGGNAGDAHVFFIAKAPDGVEEMSILLLGEDAEAVAAGNALASSSDAVFELSGEYITDGGSVNADRTSFSIEKQLPTPNGARQALVFRGMLPGGFSVNLASESIAGLSFSFLGKDAQAFGEGATAFGDGLAANAVSRLGTTLAAADTTKPFNTSADVGRIFEGDEATASAFVSSLSLDLSNNLRAQNAVGHLGAVGVGVGRSEITGTLAAYFKDFALFSKLTDEERTSLRFRLDGETSPSDGSDPEAVSYCFMLPRLRITDDSHSISGVNTDVVENLSFQALYDPGADASIVVSRV